MQAFYKFFISILNLMIAKVVCRKQYVSHLSRVNQNMMSYQHTYHSKTTKGIPPRIEEMIQYVEPGKKIETKTLEEIAFVSLNNTPVKMQIVQGDITQEETDAIVNPTDQFL